MKMVRDEMEEAIEKALDPLLAGVSHLLLALAAMPGRIPDPVMDAADEIRRAVVALGGRDVGPPPDDRGLVVEVECSCPDNCGKTFPMEFR